MRPGQESPLTLSLFCIIVGFKKRLFPSTLMLKSNLACSQHRLPSSSLSGKSEPGECLPVGVVGKEDGLHSIGLICGRANSFSFLHSFPHTRKAGAGSPATDHVDKEAGLGFVVMPSTHDPLGLYSWTALLLLREQPLALADQHHELLAMWELCAYFCVCTARTAFFWD